MLSLASIIAVSWLVSLFVLNPGTSKVRNWTIILRDMISWATYRNDGCDLVGIDDSNDLFDPDMHAKPSICQKNFKKIDANLGNHDKIICKDLSYWPEWNHVWLFDMVAKKSHSGKLLNNVIMSWQSLIRLQWVPYHRLDSHVMLPWRNRKTSTDQTAEEGKNSSLMSLCFTQTGLWSEYPKMRIKKSQPFFRPRCTWKLFQFK